MMRRDGFTLVEVLIVLLVIAIGIIPLAVVQNSSRREVAAADRYTQAVTIAHRQIEWTKGMGFAAAVADSGQYGAVNWRTEIDELEVGLRRVRVTVIYPQSVVPDTLRWASLISIR